MSHRGEPPPLEPYVAPQPDPEAGFVAIERRPIGFENPLSYLRRHLFRFGASTVRFLLRHVRGVAAVTLIGVAAEVVLQFTAPRYANRVYSDRITGGYPIEMSAAGNRGPAPSVGKPPGTIRIVALGDSVTFGTGVAVDETWPIVMGRLLQERLGRPVEVINTAVPGTDVPRASLLLSRPWGAYQPDAAVMMISGNTVSLAWIRRNEEVIPPPNPYLNPAPEPRGIRALAARAKRAAQRLVLPGFLAINVGRLRYWVGLNDHRVPPDDPRGAMLAHGWRQPDLDPRIALEAWDRLGAQLRALRSAHALPICLSYAPSEFMIGKSWLHNLKFVPRNRLSIEPSARAAEAAASAGLPFAPLKPALEAAAGQDPLYVLDDYTHLSSRGHRIAANAMAQCLLPALKELSVEGEAR